MNQIADNCEEVVRCAWVGQNPHMIAYHDTEWGVPVYDPVKLYEFIVLDAFQAGLSWQGVLNKREGLRNAFADFDYHTVASFDDGDVARLMGDSTIIRNQQKILSTIRNAQAVIELEGGGESLPELLWGIVGGQTIQNDYRHDQQIPASTRESEDMSKALKSRGFSFVGPTICYAFMQAAGLVNDHTTDCFRYNQIANIGQ